MLISLSTHTPFLSTRTEVITTGGKYGFSLMLSGENIVNPRTPPKYNFPNRSVAPADCSNSPRCKPSPDVKFRIDLVTGSNLVRPLSVLIQRFPFESSRI